MSICPSLHLLTLLSPVSRWLVFFLIREIEEIGETRVYVSETIYISRPFLLTHVRAFVTSPSTTLEPIRFRDRVQIALYDTSPHFSMIGHTCEIMYISRQNCERIAASVARSQYLVNVFGWTLCVTWLDLPGVFSSCCVVCHRSFPRACPFRFPRRCNVKISLDKRRRESDKSKPRSSPRPPPFPFLCFWYRLLQIYCVINWIYPQCNLDQIISKCPF